MRKWSEKRLLEERPLEAQRFAREVEEAVRVLRALVSRLYALGVEVKREGEDNSAEALRELFR